MKTWLLVACLFAGGGEHEKGLALYREGKFAEAAAAFRAAIAADGDSAELQYDLALASWRAGDLATAETAAEKYAALAKHARADLHRGLLGAVRHDQAKLFEERADAAGSQPAPPPATAPGAPGAAPSQPQPEDPLPLLEEALTKLNQAKEHFVAGTAAGATPELLRNTERTLRRIDELQKKIEELKKQREEQKDDQKKDDEKKNEDQKDEQKKDEQKGDSKPDEKKSDEQKPDEQKPDAQKSDEQQKDDKSQPQQGNEGDEKSEPKPQPDGKQEQQPPKDPQAAEKPEPKDEQPKPDAKPEPKPAEPRNDAPGESTEVRELTPEQTQRLMEQLNELDQKLRASRARSKASRPPVERDW